MPPETPAHHAQAPRWPIVIQGKAGISGEVFSLNQKKKFWELSDRSVPNGASLKFKLTTNVRAPYDIFWQVVNTGAEATVERDLRGGFTGPNGVTHWETTKYAGSHWVEGFVIKDGICVARSGKVSVKVRK